MYSVLRLTDVQSHIQHLYKQPLCSLDSTHTCTQVYRNADIRYTQPVSYFWDSRKIICFRKVSSKDAVSKHDLGLSRRWNIFKVKWQQRKKCRRWGWGRESHLWLKPLKGETVSGWLTSNMRGLIYNIGNLSWETWKSKGWFTRM